MSKNNVQYIAEIDETGSVEAVWVTDALGRGAHPVKSPGCHLDLVSGAICSGASSEAIHQWLHEKSLNVGQLR